MNVMKNKMFCALCVAMLFCNFLIAQKVPENWFNLDKSADNVQGVSTEKLYKTLLKGKSSQTVIVAVIDSGIDYEHEDLKDVMWVNTDEIPNNGKDDDGNGYVDDIHGWNFIGGKDGKNVDADTYEVTRLYGKYKAKYENADPSKLNKKEKKEYAIFEKTKKEVEAKYKEAEAGLSQMEATTALISGAIDAVEKALDGKDVTPDNVAALDGAADQSIAVGKSILERVFAEGETVESMDALRKDFKSQIEEGKKYYSNQVEYAYNPDFNTRLIVGDNYANQTEIGYGNNDYEGPDAFHGTHVAGIIGAARNNDIGINGVADNVQIMSLRAVPNGDERDKDVANAIRYAVDNGASIINMSFGKGYSWNKKIVDAAVKYACKKDVLLVHAAGNSGENTDEADNFPTDDYEKKPLFGKKNASNWIEVGALSWKDGEDAAATFSNYGQSHVDVFAPGVAIYSTIPDNEYKNAQGTSMASPVIAGVAAVLRSYYPALTAEQVKDIIMKSSVKNKKKVKQPGSGDLVPFSTLSVSGGTANVLNAVKMAQKVKGKKKNAKVIKP